MYRMELSQESLPLMPVNGRVETLIHYPDISGVSVRWSDTASTLVHNDLLPDDFATCGEEA